MSVFDPWRDRPPPPPPGPLLATLGRTTIWPLLAVPVVVAAGFVLAIRVVHVPIPEPPLEVAALVLTGGAVVAAALRLWRTPDRAGGLVLALALAVLWREIHLEFPLCKLLVTAVFVGLVGVAWRGYAWFEPLLTSRWGLSLLVAAAWTYTLTQALDARLLAFVPGEQDFETITEEGTELVGHAFVLALAALRPRRGP